MEQKQPKEIQDQIKTTIENNLDTEEKNQILSKSLLQHANLWMTHYLEVTSASSIIGYHMSQEVYEILEKGNNKKQSQYYFDQAIVNYYEYEDKEKSLNCLQQALKWHSKNLQALSFKGNVLRSIGSRDKKEKEYFERSQKSLSKSLAINPNYRLAQIQQAELYFCLNEQSQGKQLVESTLNQWKLSDKESYHEIHVYACGLFRLGKYQEALTMCNKVISINPRITKIYENMAGCYYMLEQYNESIEYLNKYLETHNVEKKRLSAKFWKRYFRLKKYDLALEQLKIYLEVCPENKKEDVDRYINQIERIIQLNENDNE